MCQGTGLEWLLLLHKQITTWSHNNPPACPQDNTCQVRTCMYMSTGQHARYAHACTCPLDNMPGTHMPGTCPLDNMPGTHMHVHVHWTTCQVRTCMYMSTRQHARYAHACTWTRQHARYAHACTCMYMYMGLDDTNYIHDLQLSTTLSKTQVCLHVLSCHGYMVGCGCLVLWYGELAAGCHVMTPHPPHATPSTHTTSCQQNKQTNTLC